MKLSELYDLQSTRANCWNFKDQCKMCLLCRMKPMPRHAGKFQTHIENNNTTIAAKNICSAICLTSSPFHSYRYCTYIYQQFWSIFVMWLWMTSFTHSWIESVAKEASTSWCVIISQHQYNAVMVDVGDQTDICNRWSEMTPWSKYLPRQILKLCNSNFSGNLEG